MNVAGQAWRPEDALTGLLGGRDSHRVGTVEQRRFPIETGVPGLNLSFSHDTVADGFFSPLHRHCWDQVRFVLDGALNIGQTDLEPGDCGYFPEAVPYGPQRQAGAASVLVLQFTGASGLYYPTPGELSAAREKLRAAGGTFEGGRYRGRGPDGEAVEQDGYEALWEAQTGCKLVYAQPRYAGVVVMRSGSFEWLADQRHPGIDVKPLGCFSEQQTAVTLIRIAPGAHVDGKKLAAPQLRYVLTGTVSLGEALYPPGSCFWIPAGTAAHALGSLTGAELFAVSLPRYAP
jgi:quercetin dioxygenase-like cupin family protein